MKTTIDKAGRIVVPKALREELGFLPGQELQVSSRDGMLEVEAPPTPMRLEEAKGGLVAVADQAMPVLTVDQVRETLEHTRR